ncbi:hypothetical protein PHYPSEUDO_001704 [Phytophthora pseudosyringae]|uniref:Uncharacterized protein n=1 Tax=Phytophthora pseudosyringae TaxID=221518 RepID=A0A8T1VV94_9STRA|nr:hypothetical protein PHYPSEUDO_001704 [Phytophthora pseudosyringae]
MWLRLLPRRRGSRDVGRDMLRREYEITIGTTTAAALITVSSTIPILTSVSAVVSIAALVSTSEFSRARGNETSKVVEISDSRDD